MGESILDVDDYRLLAEIGHIDIGAGACLTNCLRREGEHRLALATHSALDDARSPDEPVVGQGERSCKVDVRDNDGADRVTEAADHDFGVNRFLLPHSCAVAGSVIDIMRDRNLAVAQ